MEVLVYKKNYAPPIINEKEVLRYACVIEKTDVIKKALNECFLEAQSAFTYSVCYAEFSVKVDGTTVDFGFKKVQSKNLASNLKGVKKCVIFCATIGSKFDRLLNKYSLISPSKALLLQGLGAERIESLCNEFNKEITEKFHKTTPRFSPGYGDLSLDFQRDVLNVLQASKNIGVTLTDSSLMSPSKSVTAIIGVLDSNNNDFQVKSPCTYCESEFCEFRK